MVLKREAPVVPHTQTPTEEPTVLGLADFFIEKEIITDTTLSFVPTWNGRIQGVIDGPPDEVRKIFQTLESNDPVPVRDFIEHIKKIRTRIFQEKQRHAERGVR